MRAAQDVIGDLDALAEMAVHDRSGLEDIEYKVRRDSY
jgi:hypothetical protein